ncbi:MAG: hypothetical protein ACXW4C_05715 [Nitrospira sp.]
MTWRDTQLRCWFICLLLISSVHATPAQAVVSGSSNPSPPTFNEKELFPYKAKGRGGAAGQVFLRASSGKAVTQAGASLYLIPMASSTRYWFDKHVRENSCPSKSAASSPESPVLHGSPVECLREVMAHLLTDKKLIPYLRTTRANPTGHFWFTKVPAGRYYVVSLLEGSGGAHQDERAVGIAWLTIDLDVDEKATNLVVTDCKSVLC